MLAGEMVMVDALARGSLQEKLQDDREQHRPARMSGGNADQNPPIAWPTLLAYGGLAMPLAMIGLPLAIYLAPFYAGELGLPLALLGTAMLIGRFSDVIGGWQTGLQAASSSGVRVVGVSSTKPGPARSNP
jgi:hypothetical protein